LVKRLNIEASLRGKDIKEFEILPFCDGGLNTYQELVILKEVALEYNPDMLVLQFTDNDSNPFGTEFVTNGGIYITTKTDLVFVAERFIPVLPLLNKRINIFLFNYSKLMRFISYKINLVGASNLVMAMKGEKSGEQVSLDAIKEMSQIAKTKGIPFLLFVFTPTADKVNFCFNPNNQDKPNPWHTKVKTLCEGLGIYYFNICDYKKDINSLKSFLESGCYGCHYNAEGHKIVADVLTEEILKLVK
jgi:hypothetical protein